jgi:phosphate transport system protein
MSGRNSFSEELSRLRHDILEMATRVEENLGKALAALRAGDADLAKEVRYDDTEVDALHIKIELDTASIIATQQPVARDLRELVMILKVIGNIERIGDHAVHLSKAARKLAKRGESPFRAQENLERMAEIGQEMLRGAVSAFLQQDAAAAREVALMDSLIDKEHETITEDVLKLMKKNPELVKAAVQILQTANQLERLGDHITNICEAVIYITEGTHEELND